MPQYNRTSFFFCFIGKKKISPYCGWGTRALAQRSLALFFFHWTKLSQGEPMVTMMVGPQESPSRFHRPSGGMYAQRFKTLGLKEEAGSGIHTSNMTRSVSKGTGKPDSKTSSSVEATRSIKDVRTKRGRSLKYLLTSLE